jgi:hypothetical protein
MTQRNIRITISIALMILLGFAAVTALKAETKDPNSSCKADGNAPTASKPDANCAAGAKQAGDMEPIPLVLPKPMYVGTPQNFQGITNLVKPLG